MNATTEILVPRPQGSGESTPPAPACPHCAGPLTFRRMDFDLYRPHLVCWRCEVAWDCEEPR